jgi:hypothetical protein
MGPVSRRNEWHGNGKIRRVVGPLQETAVEQIRGQFYLR